MMSGNLVTVVLMQSVSCCAAFELLFTSSMEKLRNVCQS